jgi:LysM repeat protein
MGVVVGRAGSLLGASLFIVAACSAGTDSASPITGSISADVTASAPEPTAEIDTTTTITHVETTEPDVEVECVVTVAAGDSLGRIAGNANDLTVEAIQEENRLDDTHVIHPGDQLDVCVRNDLDDVSGASRLPPGPQAVRRQQQQLNELFAPFSIADLAVDGISGPLTRQMLCAARMGLGLRIDAIDMSEGSPEETTLFEAESLSVPDGAAVWANRWILIDKTCQVVFIGESGERITDVYPTSTGEPGFETLDLQAAPAFRYDPALDNNGWHDSARFPVAIDNPLNGNMYKPLYFNGGQAIHGANNVPPDPRSKGCARLLPWHQDALIGWLELDDVTDPTWRRSQIGVTVTAQGDYRPVD